MYITQCIVSKTGLINNKLLELTSGVNVISSPNDSGKSLILRAIVDCIFGTPNNKCFLDKTDWEDLYVNAVVNSDNNTFKFIRNGNEQFSVSQIDSNANECEIFTGKTDSTEICNTLCNNKIFSACELCNLIKLFSSTDFFNISYVISPFETFIKNHFSKDSFYKAFLSDNNSFA